MSTMSTKSIIPFMHASILALLLALLSSCSGSETDDIRARDTGHPILLVVAEDEGASAETWSAILTERFGGTDLLRASEWVRRLQSRKLDREIMILSSSLMDHADSSLVTALRLVVHEQGLIVVLDQPGPDWEAASGLRNIGSEGLPLRWPYSAWSPWQGGEVSRPAEEPLARTEPPPLHLDLELRYLIQRPRSRGVRNVGTPFGVPSVWWKPEGEGGFISLGVPLPQLVEGIRDHTKLDTRQRRRWQSAAIESTLDPDVFPRLYPRVWLRSTPSQASAPPDEALARARADLSWRVEAVGKEGHRVQILRGSPDLELELALPLRWRGQILADWQCDWPEAQSRKVLGPQREWRVLRAPPREGTLELRYRLAQGASRWR